MPGESGLLLFIDAADHCWFFWFFVRLYRRGHGCLRCVESLLLLLLKWLRLLFLSLINNGAFMPSNEVGSPLFPLWIIVSGGLSAVGGRVAVSFLLLLDAVARMAVIMLGVSVGMIMGVKVVIVPIIPLTVPCIGRGRCPTLIGRRRGGRLGS